VRQEIRSSLAAAGRWVRTIGPERAHLRADIVAGLPRAISSVPDGMAAAVLAGVNPVQGLYAGFAGPIAGGLSSHTRLMVITTTSAAALAAGSALAGVPPDQRPGAIALLVILAGAALVSSLFALVIPTVVIVLAGAESVARVGDAGGIPRGVPLPHLPDFRLFSFSLVTGALAVAAIVLVQGAGVAEAAPNPGEARPNPDQDIIAQGVGNLASGLFRGIPVGGSVGQTALNVSVGARTRWAAIWSGIWLLVILALFSGLVARIAVPTLAAILIFAAIGSFQPREIASILRTGRGSQIAIITTFGATLFLPVAAAVGIGVALSLLLQLNQEAMDLTVVELIPLEDGRFEERPSPAALTSHHVTTLDVYGSLMYAGARTLQAHLPDPAGTQSPAVVLRLRRRTSLGATFVKVVGDYADRLAAVDGRLYLSGLDPSLSDRLRRTGHLDGPVHTFEATPVVGESTRAASLDAEAWLVTRHGE
jgi:SulP family sulfate permease